MSRIVTQLAKRLCGFWSPGGTDARLSILIYHRVHAVRDSMFAAEVTADLFDAQMALVRELFNVLSLREAVPRLQSGTLPPRAACITFDDGYADNVTQALPILLKHRLTATFFIASAYLNGGRMFNDTIIEAVRRCPHPKVDLTQFGLGQYELSRSTITESTNAILRQIKYFPLGQREDLAAAIAEALTSDALPCDLMMTTAQLQALHAAGMEIGGHTAHHPILARLDASAAKAEIVAGKHRLEEILNEPIASFAYPNGKPGDDYLPAQAALVREAGFNCALSTVAGVTTVRSDLFQLPRYSPWQRMPARFTWGLLKNLKASAG